MLYDILVIGSGPAGVTASIYAARAQKSVLVIEKEAFGGLITHSPKVENYPGFDSISGMDLADKFIAQAMNLGVFFEFDKIIGIDKKDNIFTLYGEHGNYEGKSVIIATGSKHRTLKLANEEELVGKGISYCAVCDGPFYANQDVMIVGGGNSAMQEAILLSSYCTSVTMIQNLPFLTGEKALADQIAKTDNIKVLYNKVVVSLNGTSNLESITVLDQTTQETEQMTTHSLFVAIGQEADNAAFANVCTLDDNGFIISDDLSCTNVAGVYVAGDCRKKRFRQISTAISDGTVAVLQAINYLDK